MLAALGGISWVFQFHQRKRAKSCLAAKRWRPQRRRSNPAQDLNDKAARAIEAYIASQNLGVQGVQGV